MKYPAKYKGYLSSNVSPPVVDAVDVVVQLGLMIPLAECCEHCVCDFKRGILIINDIIH